MKAHLLIIFALLAILYGQSDEYCLVHLYAQNPELQDGPVHIGEAPILDHRTDVAEFFSAPFYDANDEIKFPGFKYVKITDCPTETVDCRLRLYNKVEPGVVTDGIPLKKREIEFIENDVIYSINFCGKSADIACGASLTP